MNSLRHPNRALLPEGIVIEFIVPKKVTRKVLILCPGAPGVPNPGPVLRHLAGRGFLAIALRYRGSWESTGSFLRYPLDEDVLAVLRAVKRGIHTSGIPRTKIAQPQCTIVGTSFGGPAALFVSRRPEVQSVICISGVVDWRRLGSVEPLSEMWETFRTGFPGAYRGRTKDWRRLGHSPWYNPASQIDRIAGQKVLFIHTSDDRVVPIGPVRRLAKTLGGRIIVAKRGGHLGTSILLRPRYWRVAQRWISSTTRAS